MIISELRHKNKRTGFTLIEVQIGMVLLVLIMGLLFGALHLASKSWQTGQAYNEMNEDKRLVAEFLRRQISQITPLFWSDVKSSALIFRGESDSMMFVGRLPANRNVGELSLMKLISKIGATDDAGKRLELGYGKLDPDLSPFNSREKQLKYTLVLEQIKDIQFQYFGQQKSRLDSEPPEWSDSWSSKKILPQLIKCQIILMKGKQWPEMIFPLHADDTSRFRQFILRASTNIESNTQQSLNDEARDIKELF